MTTAELEKTVRATVAKTPIQDIHTHLYDPAFGDLLLWGIDELLVYHYLVAESFRYFSMSYAEFWALPKSRQAELIWDVLFIQNSPVSESCRGVLTTLNNLGLDVKKRDLPKLRKWFAKQKPGAYIDHCMELAGVSDICMTNSPFDDLERPVWERGFKRHPAFSSALRIDPILMDWKSAAPKLAAWGYQVSSGRPNQKTFDEIRRFFADWTKRMDARYLMVSLPPTYMVPAATDEAAIIEGAVMPHCREFGIPFAVMPGVKKLINPDLRLAGDGVGRSDLMLLQNLCGMYPDNKIAATLLSRENHQEAAVLARKFRNLHIFGCWWFTNIPELINEITRMRIELLGLSFTPQHSDARVLDQIVYKWDHSRKIIADILVEKYRDLAATGWATTKSEIERDVKNLFGGAFEAFCRR
jgi:hypothetical protein